MNLTHKIIKSWATTETCICTMDQIMQWIKHRNEIIKVRVDKMPFSYEGFWYYDSSDGYIRNLTNSFFQLAGYQEIEGNRIIKEQPIIIQNEIGFLGIICKEFDGILHFLMQAKVEPGNINQIQISPTIQATKSNFTKCHGGKTPAYLDYFFHATDYTIVVDQVQSEQASRFLKKRNRNIVILVDGTVEVCESHMWMTLGQIKQLLKYDNLVNMDTRTVLANLPLTKNHLCDQDLNDIYQLFFDKTLFESMFADPSEAVMHKIFNRINDFRMFDREQSRLVPLKSMKSWELTENEIVCKSFYDFKVVYCHIEIEGREVSYWEQPLLESNGQAVFGLFTCVERGIRKYLVKVKHEIGNFDAAELGPTVQLEPSNPRNRMDNVESLFLKKLEENEGILNDVVLSEEGGRFYHEQNRNVIIEIEKNEIQDFQEEYFWVEFSLLNWLIQWNNCLNIQLRNLLVLINI